MPWRYPNSEEQVSSCVAIFNSSVSPGFLICRFGLGLILQAKVKLSPAEESQETPRRRSLLRRLSNMMSTRRRSGSVSTDSHGNPPDEGEPNGSRDAPFHRRLTRRITRMLSQQSEDSPPPKAKYKTRLLHTFMLERFPGASKLEEHQVCDGCYIHDYLVRNIQC